MEIIKIWLSFFNNFYLIFIRKSCGYFYRRKRHLFLAQPIAKYVSIIAIVIPQTTIITKPVLLPNATVIAIIITKVDEITILIYFTSRIL